MLNVLLFILRIIGLVVVAFIAYTFLRKYVFSKIKVNKWIIIGIAVVVFLLPLVLNQVGVVPFNATVSLVQSVLFAILFLWLLDAVGFRGKQEQAYAKKSNVKNPKYSVPTVIRAKAKPNRLKNTDMEIIDIKDIKKKKKK